MLDNPQYSGAMCTWPEIVLMHGVSERMPDLAQKYKCVVVSNAAESNAELMKKAFERIEMDQYFYLFVTSKELGAKKPEQAFFVNALSVVGADASEVAMIGNDYDKDIAPAHDIGMMTILIAGGDSDYPKATHKIKSFSELAFL